MGAPAVFEKVSQAALTNPLTAAFGATGLFAKKKLDKSQAAQDSAADASQAEQDKSAAEAAALTKKRERRNQMFAAMYKPVGGSIGTTNTLGNSGRSTLLGN